MSTSSNDDHDLHWMRFTPTIDILWPWPNPKARDFTEEEREQFAELLNRKDHEEAAP